MLCGYGEFGILIIVSGIVKWYCHFGKELGFPQNVKHGGTMWPSSSTPRNDQKEMKTNVHTKTYMDVHSIIINSGQR